MNLRRISEVLAKSLVVTLALSVSISAARPQPAQAIIGAATGAVPVMVIGGVLLGAGTGIESAACVIDGTTALGGRLCLEALPWTVPLFVLGLVLLDDESQGNKLEYRRLSDKDARALRLNEKQRRQFNSELEEANAVREAITAELAARERPTAEASYALWQEYRDLLSPETFDAIEKIGQRFIEEIAN